MADVTNSTPSYLGGDDNVLSGCLCYLGGSDSISGSQSGYVDGSSSELSGCPSYLCGSNNETSSQPCHLSGLSDIIDNISGYVHGEDNGLSSFAAYLLGSTDETSSQTAYTVGSIFDTTIAYLSGNLFVKDSQSAFIPGLSGNVTGEQFSYCFGIQRYSVDAYLIGVYPGGGDYMPTVDYIWLKTSDLSLSKKFKVIAQDYDDGTLEKSEEVNKTIGGGIDHSVGAVYKTWSPIIRVRHTETETDYGDKDDLEYFYELNNPNGTPSNDITFIDHHSTEYTVHTVGKLSKNAMGCQLDGECAWFLYRLQFMRVQ